MHAYPELEKLGLTFAAKKLHPKAEEGLGKLMMKGITSKSKPQRIPTETKATKERKQKTMFVLYTIAAGPKLSEDVQKITGFSYDVVRNYIGQLVASGLLQSQPHFVTKNKRVYSLTEAGIEKLKR